MILINVVLLKENVRKESTEEDHNWVFLHETPKRYIKE